jgi:hypothetical protein
VIEQPISLKLQRYQQLLHIIRFCVHTRGERLLESHYCSVVSRSLITELLAAGKGAQFELKTVLGCKVQQLQPDGGFDAKRAFVGPFSPLIIALAHQHLLAGDRLESTTRPYDSILR